MPRNDKSVTGDALFDLTDNDRDASNLIKSKREAK
jgi:hypothetical protein